MKKSIKALVLLAIISVAFTSCKEEISTPTPTDIIDVAEKDTLITSKDTSGVFQLDSWFTISWDDNGVLREHTMVVWEDASEENAYYTTSADLRFSGIRFSNITEVSRLSYSFTVSNNNGGSRGGTFSQATGKLTFMYGSTPITGVAQ